MHVLKRTELIDVPWRNGGGITRNISKGLSGDCVAWTISRADVTQDGPFSDFAGMTRVLTVVSGGTMLLQAPSHTIEASMWEPVHFDGALKVNSRLIDGPLTDLNLMFDPNLCNGTVTLKRDSYTGQVKRPEHGLIAFHVLSGAPQIDAARMSAGDTAFITEDGVMLHLGKGDAVLEIRLDYVTHKEAIKLCIAPL